MKATVGWISLTVALSLVNSSIHYAQAAPVDVEGSQDAAWHIGSSSSSSSSSRDTIRVAADPCQKATATAGLISYDVIKACLDADFPFPVDHRQKTAETIKRVIQGGYVFEDLAANPPTDGLADGLSVDQAPIVETVEALASQTNGTWREFHDGIHKAFVQAHDAHLGYRATCFDRFKFQNGLIMGDMQDSETGARKLMVIIGLTEFAQLASVSFRPDGCEVVTIQNQPAAEFLQAWADANLAGSKDANVRYNSAVGNPVFKPYSNGYILFGDFASHGLLPDEASLLYGFRCPHLWGNDEVKQVDVKWGGKYEGGRYGLTVRDYYNAFCVNANYANAALSDADTAKKLKAKDAKSDSQDRDWEEEEEKLVKLVQSSPWESLPEEIQQWAIDKVVREFKEMPSWLSQRTQEVILGPEEEGGSRSKIEWSDETSTAVLRERAEKILQAMPAFDPVPPLPIFEQRQPVAQMPDYSNFGGAATSDYTILLNSPSGLYAILLADGKTGVITIPTFSPRNTGLLSYSSYYANLLQAVDALRPMAERVIIDVTGNGGGSICLSERFTEVFFPELPSSVTNIRLSPVERQLLNIHYGYYDNYLTTSETEHTTPAYLTEAVSHPNRQFNFTNYFADDCSGLQYPKLSVDPEAEARRPRAVNKGYVYDPDKPYHPWDPEDLLIFSDGSCGSACATFSNQLVQKAKVAAVAVGGGRRGERMSYSSFPGGQVVQAEDQYFKKQRALKSAFNRRFVNDDDEDDGEHAGALSSGQQKQSQQPLEKRQGDGDDVDGALGTRKSTYAQASITFTKQQRDELLKVLPEPLQLRATLSLTYRQAYYTGDTLTPFVEDDQGQWVPTWGPEVGQWAEYTFLPATYRVNYTFGHFQKAHTLWEDARDAAWQ